MGVLSRLPLGSEIDFMGDMRLDERLRRTVAWKVFPSGYWPCRRP